MAYVGQALAQPTARAVARHFLENAVAAFTGELDPRGCLSVVASTACGSEAECIREEVVKRSRVVQEALAQRMQRAIEEGDFHGPANAEAMGKYLLAVVQGMSVQAGAGASRKELEGVVETTLAMWPSR